jgi:hypothetical protein
MPTDANITIDCVLAWFTLFSPVVLMTFPQLNEWSNSGRAQYDICRLTEAPGTYNPTPAIKHACCPFFACLYSCLTYHICSFGTCIADDLPSVT